MKIALLLALLLIVAMYVVAGVRKRAARAATLAAQARARAARQRRVPNVSNNLKGVTATQTIDPYKPKSRTERDAEQD